VVREGTSAPELNGAAMNGHAAPAAPGQQNGHTGTTAARDEAVARQTAPPGNGRKPTTARLDDEARADAIVQEVQREFGAQVVEVRPPDDERGPE
jgi:hypothetical protein